MNFWQIFLRILPRRPGAALAAAWYQLTRRRVRARNRLRVAGASLPFAYDLWMRNREREEAVAHQAALANEAGELRARFTLIVDNRGGDAAALEGCLQSIRQQSAPLCQEIKVFGSSTGDCGSLLEAIRASTGEHIIVLRTVFRLARNALYLLSTAIADDPDGDVYFGDEDRVDADGRRSDAWFKPEWNRELYLATDYVSAACALRASVARQAADDLESREVSIPALLLHVAQSGGRMVHIPQVLVHRTDAATAPWLDHEAAVATAVAREGGRTSPGPFDTIRVSWPLPKRDEALVSVIIPTRDKVELLRKCVQTLLERTDHSPLEVIIVDNGSEQQATRQFLDEIGRDPRVHVHPAPGPYNYSALNNDAAAFARGDFLCLLNNDTEIIKGDWLGEMLRYAVRPEVGAVGAKLLYPDGSIQHAGVVVGIGDAAGHAHRYLPAADAGYFALPHVTHYVTAVTGACLLVSKAKFEAVGGLDAESFAVAYNDVDFCLKLQKAGWRNVYVPHAVLIHHESKSRGKDHAPDQIDRYRGELRRFQERWGIADYSDPVFNPNLDRSNETFILRF